MVACPSCETECPPGYRYCPACGAALATPRLVHEERKVVTVVFVDLAGFTARSEALDPEGARALVRAYHAILRTEVERFGGTLARVAGDAGMAVFGYPAAHEDDPVRAVLAALAILTGLESLNAERPALDLHARIGVNTSEAVVTFGSALEDADDLMGDGVNVASRIQAIAPPDATLVGEATYRATAHFFRYAALEPATVKGKAEPVALWRALGALASPAVQLGPETTPFVGRDQELRALVDIFEGTRTSTSPAFVTILAQPGLGKSRLVRELAHHVDGLPHPVTWRVGRCLPYGGGISLWALGEIVRSHAGIVDTDDQASLARKLDAVLTETDPTRRAWMADRLAPLVGLETSTHPPQQEEAFIAWRRFLESIAEAGPTVLVIEDLHWADDTLVSFVTHVAEHTVGLPLLVIATARPEVTDRHPSWLARNPRSTVLSLAALPDAAMATLVSGSLPDASPALVATVLERAGGSPLYAEQFAAMVRDRPPIDGGGFDQDAIPASIAALLAARIDALPPDAKATLLDAAVVGRTFWSGAVAALSGRERAELEPAWTELARRELVRPAEPSSLAGEAEFAFRHALIREVAYGQLTRADRLRRHRAAAAWLVGRPGATSGEDAEIVVAHLDRAIELATATRAAGEIPVIRVSLVDALLAAASRSRHAAPGRARGHLERALALMPEDDARRGAVCADLGRAAQQLGDLPEAIVAFREAIALLDRNGDPDGAAALGWPLAYSLAGHGEADEARSVLAAAKEVLVRSPGPGLVDLLAGESRWMNGDLRYDEGRDLAEEALTWAAHLGLPAPHRALGEKGQARLYLGDAGGIDDLERAAELALAEGSTSGAAVHYLNLAVRLFDFRGPRDALPFYDRAIETAARVGGRAWWSGRGLRAMALFSAGRWDEVVDEAAEVATWAATHGDTWTLSVAEILTSHVACERGVPIGDPLEMASRARGLGSRAGLATTLPYAAELALAEGDRPTAGALLLELADSAADGGLFESSPAVRTSLRLGDVDLARRFELEPDTDLPVDRHDRRMAQAMLLEAGGDLAAASSAYATSVQSWRAFGDVVEEANALAGLGRCAIALGETADGAARLGESRAIRERLGAAPGIAEIDALLATLPAGGSRPAGPAAQA